MLANWINNLNDTGRKVLFGVVAVVLVVAAWWGMSDNETPAERDEPTGDGTAVVVPDPSTAAPETGTDEAPASDGSLSVVVTTPVDEAQLDTIARKAAAFVSTYQSFRYADDPDAKVAAIRKYLSRNSQVAPELAVPTGTALAAIRADKTNVAVTAQRVEVTLIAPTTVVFVVDAQAATTRDGVTDVQERTYSVTLYKDGTGWGVGDFSFDGDTAE
jgi:hypothetical protein